MGTFTEEITLANAVDIINARNGLIPGTKIRSLTVDAMPDTGAWTLIINEEIRQKLGLAIVKTVESSLADGSTTDYGLTEPVEIRWRDRDISLQAVVIPNAGDILLGALPLEGMDLYVDPVNQRLAGVHGDRRVHLVKLCLTTRVTPN
ncbi:MAG: aspartyl protease family protein [Treponema sp.]|jgi:clan AA aspartic protease|nr:aspartyl protease family protein [Treponema sp.]